MRYKTIDSSTLTMSNDNNTISLIDEDYNHVIMNKDILACKIRNNEAEVLGASYIDGVLRQTYTNWCTVPVNKDKEKKLYQRIEASKEKGSIIFSAKDMQDIIVALCGATEDKTLSFRRVTVQELKGIELKASMIGVPIYDLSKKSLKLLVNNKNVEVLHTRPIALGDKTPFSGISFKEIKLDDVDMSRLVNFSGYFRLCKLGRLDLRGIDFSSVVTAARAFEESTITELYLNGANFINLESAFGMFMGLNSREVELDGAKFDSLVIAQAFFLSSVISNLSLRNVQFPKLVASLDTYYWATIDNLDTTGEYTPKLMDYKLLPWLLHRSI